MIRSSTTECSYVSKLRKGSQGKKGERLVLWYSRLCFWNSVLRKNQELQKQRMGRCRISRNKQYIPNWCRRNIFPKHPEKYVFRATEMILLFLKKTSFTVTFRFLLLWFHFRSKHWFWLDQNRKDLIRHVRPNMGWYLCNGIETLMMILLILGNIWETQLNITPWRYLIRKHIIRNLNQSPRTIYFIGSYLLRYLLLRFFLTIFHNIIELIDIHFG